MTIYDELSDMIEILDDFVVETHELIEQLNEDLLTLEEGVDEDTVNRIFRAFHTIKGTSGFLNFEVCMDLAHAAEDLLNKIRNGEMDPTGEIVDVLLESVDWFKDFLADIESRADKDWDASDIHAAIKKTMNGHADLEVAEEKSNSTKAENAVVELNAPQELLDEFVTESTELLEALSNDLLSLEIEPENEELVNGIFRVFHTLKGNSGLLGLDEMSEIAHKSEDILGKIRDKELTPDSFLVDTLLASLDYLKTIIGEVREGQVQEHDTMELLFDLSKALQNGSNGKAQVTEETVEVEVAPQKAQESAESKEKAKAKPAAKSSTAQKKVEQTIRVDVDRLDNLMNIAGELVLEKNRLQQISLHLSRMLSGEKEAADLDSLNNSLGYITTEIQESVMQMRMLPIANVFRKFPRLVRDLAKEKDKQIKLVISGEDTELDRSVIEAIGDPLVHLLRNAIDHGVEAPDIRKQNGKAAEGTIHLSAFQEGNQIVIEIEDDGAGIDPEKISAKCLEKEIISQEEISNMQPRDIVQLIFRPGFSTAEKITDVSGRGVGMDVVNSNIAKLNGTVEINTDVGKGTKFTIKLPLTLTIMSGMVVRSWDELYIIPLISISETLRLEDRMISSVKGQQVLNLRNSVLPIIYMDDLLVVPHEQGDTVEQYIVVVNIGDKSLGLVVSELLGQEETVVKPLGQALGKVKYFAGATLRGDGRVALILDVPEIVDSGFAVQEVA